MFKLVRKLEVATVDERPFVELKVQRKWQEARDIVCLELVSATGLALPVFEAGAFIELMLQGGAARSYSLANAPHERYSYVIAVLLERAGQGGSRFIHNEVNEGDLISISAPRNGLSLHGGAVYSVLLAGGIGVAPIMAMAEDLWRRGSAFEIHYCVRSLERAAFMKRLRLAPYASRVKVWSSAPGATGRLDMPTLLKRLPRLTHLYVCGPQGLRDSAMLAATRQGWDAAQIHQESFGS